MRVEWKRKALKQLREIPFDYRCKIGKAVEGLMKWPDCGMDIKKLSGRSDYRLRVGRYRVIFDIFDSLEIISIEEVKKRDEHTY